MAFKDFAGQEQSVELLQRSLERGRLGHAYLLTGHQLAPLEALARTLAQTLNCQSPARAGGVAVDCCGTCLNCRKIEHGNHVDVHWVRPESRSRVIVIEQMRELMQEINLKPTEADFKVAIIVAADRLNASAANAFLKTLEEPPAKSVLILLSTEPQRLLETILSRCLRLNFAGEGGMSFGPDQLEWLAKFSEMASAEEKSLLGRYRLLDVLMRKLGETRERVEETLTARSPLERFDDVERDLREKWEEELKAAIEAEYRWQRTGTVLAMQCWLRDVWLHTLASGCGLLSFPALPGAQRVAGRISTKQALENLQVIEQTQRLLQTNVQEALALEVGLLKLNL
jgi:DNA polymerase-3 subunit delta'